MSPKIAYSNDAVPYLGSLVMWCASVHEVAPNSAAAAGKVSRRRQPNFGRRAARQPDLVRASRKSGGGAAEGSTNNPVYIP